MTELRNWAAQWGDIASVIGVLLTMVGFGITFFGVWRSKTAAEQASRAAVATRESIAQYDAIGDLSSATAIMDEIKRLQRHGDGQCFRIDTQSYGGVWSQLRVPMPT